MNIIQTIQSEIDKMPKQETQQLQRELNELKQEEFEAEVYRDTWLKAVKRYFQSNILTY